MKTLILLEKEHVFSTLEKKIEGKHTLFIFWEKKKEILLAFVSLRLSM